MNIKERIKQDIANLTVTEEIEMLRVSLKDYMVKLNNYLYEQGGMTFDYYGGCFHHHGYFDFDKNYLFILDCEGNLATIRLWCSPYFDAEFKFYTKTGNLTYWSHSVKSLQAKDKIKHLVGLIDGQVKDLQ